MTHFQQASFALIVIQFLTALTELRTVAEFFCILEKIFPLKCQNLNRCKLISKVSLVKLTWGKKKWLLSCLYYPNRKNIVNHVKNISTGLDQFSATYDNLILLGDFNFEPEEVNILDFLNIYNLKNLVKQKPWKNNPENPSCKDLILTNSHKSFQITVFEAGFSDFHKMTVSVLKSHFSQQKPNIVSYRSYKRFRNNSFRTELDNELLKYDLCNIEYQHFLNIFLDILNKHAPIKKKVYQSKSE